MGFQCCVWKSLGLSSSLGDLGNGKDSRIVVLCERHLESARLPRFQGSPKESHRDYGVCVDHSNLFLDLTTYGVWIYSGNAVV